MNWKYKTCEGFSVTFALFNFTGFLFYSIYSFYGYYLDHEAGVEIQDVVFPTHAFILTCI